MKRAASVLVVALVSACGVGADEPPAPGAATTPSSGHTHGAAGISMVVGDGTRAEEVGYHLDDVSLPRAAGTPGTLSFRLVGSDGEPVTDFVLDHTKDLHLYVVRSDLAVFRHLHPTTAGHGRWSVRTNLPSPGSYRVVTEFVARDEGGGGDHVMLGASATLDEGLGDQAGPEPEDGDGVVAVDVVETPEVGPNGQLVLRVRDAEGRPLSLGEYLGAQAHVVGFHEGSGAVVHLHPTETADQTGAGTVLTFGTELATPGRYVWFVQVRVDGFLHTVGVATEVAAAATG